MLIELVLLTVGFVAAFHYGRDYLIRYLGNSIVELIDNIIVRVKQIIVREGGAVLQNESVAKAVNFVASSASKGQRGQAFSNLLQANNEEEQVGAENQSQRGQIAAGIRRDLEIIEAEKRSKVIEGNEAAASSEEAFEELEPEEGLESLQEEEGQSVAVKVEEEVIESHEEVTKEENFQQEEAGTQIVDNPNEKLHEVNEVQEEVKTVEKKTSKKESKKEERKEKESSEIDISTSPKQGGLLNSAKLALHKLKDRKKKKDEAKGSTEADDREDYQEEIEEKEDGATLKEDSHEALDESGEDENASKEDSEEDDIIVEEISEASDAEEDETDDEEDSDDESDSEESSSDDE